MPTFCRSPKSIAGFTLLEMMLTMGLIALTATFVGLNIGQSDSRLALLEAKRFVALVNLAQDESILTGRPIKLEFDSSERQYQFKPVAADAWFELSHQDQDQQGEGQREDDQDADESDTRLGDQLLKIRKIPEGIGISFDIEPREPKKSAASKFVAKRVHEILNESILDKASEQFDDEASDSGVLIEPNGLISPFSLTLSQENRATTVELDRYGKAAIKLAKP